MQREHETRETPRDDLIQPAFCPDEEENVQASVDDAPSRVEVRGEAPNKWKERIARVQPIVTAALAWSFGVLVLLFLAFITFGILYSGIYYHGAQWHEPPADESCTTSFGSLVGAYNGVFAYSNCKDKDEGEVNALPSASPNMTGLKWQCVEYARRYWMLRGTPAPATFSSVKGAADIWELNDVQLLDGTITPLLKYQNGLSLDSGGSQPRVGDILIYPRQKGGFEYGHVAVIVDVLAKSILVAEQNWDNNVWPSPYHNYSRAIPMLYDSSRKTYTLQEEDDIIVQGWMRYSV